MKTKSLWGLPPTRYYNFLKRVESEFNQSNLKLCVLGCSDGKFVIPAARRGFEVLAIDIDEKAIFGGNKISPHGDIYMEGLTSRVKKEKLEDKVTIVNADFFEYVTPKKYHAVWTSGAINYSYNLKNNIGDIIEKVKSYVLPNGFLYFDYMLPLEKAHFERENYFKLGELSKFFKNGDWEIIYDKVLPPLMEKAHVDLPVDHYHHWGHLCVKLKNKNE